MYSVLRVLGQVVRWVRIAIAMQRLRKFSKEEQGIAKNALGNLLGEARGMTMKIGQLMAGIEVNDPLRPLITSIKPLSLSKILPALKAHGGMDVLKHFSSIDESLAAASLGQVHHAVLHDGSDVAVKIRYPGIVDTVNAELALSDWMPSAGPFRRWGFDADDYKQTLRQQLLKETDYLIESKTQQRFKCNLNIAGLQIPDIYPTLCKENVLVQSWEHGCRFDEVCSWSKKDRLEVGRVLLITLFQSLFVHGEVHGDPHMGNYLFRHGDDGKPVVVLLDYGCKINIETSRRIVLLKLINSLRQGEVIDPLQCFVEMGFEQSKLRHIEDKLPELCDLLFLPFISPRPFHVQDWQLGVKIHKLLSEQRWWFRPSGPADLILLLRAFHGISQQLIQLNVALPWGPLLQYSVGTKLLEQAKQTNLSEPGRKDECVQPEVIMSARKLCVEVYQGDIKLVFLELPVEMVLELKKNIPENVLAGIEQAGEFDFEALSNRLQIEGVHPQILIQSNSATKVYKVWLE